MLVFCGVQRNHTLSTALRRAFILCVICLAVFQFSENTADPDLWGHVLFGETFLQTHQLAQADPYSWTAPGNEWINHEIVAEVALGAAHRALGGPGLLLLKILVGLLTCGIALTIALKRMTPGARLVAWAFGGLAVVEISFGFAARPQIFTALAFALEFWILQEVHQGRKIWAIALPPLFALWINTHGGVVAGIVLLFAAAGATAAHGLLKKFIPEFIRPQLEAPPEHKTVWWLGSFTILSALAMMVNPYGFKLIRWLVESVLWLRPEIDEWNPAALNWDHAAFFFCIILAAAAFMFSRRPRQPWQMAIVALLAVVAVRSVRNTPLFCIAALAFVPPHLADVLDRFREASARLIELVRRPAVQKVLTALLLLTAMGIVAATLTAHKQRAWTMEVPHRQYPVAAVKFIQAHGLHGNLTVFFDWGEECLWELPDSRVSLDGRLDTCYPRKVIAAHWKFYNAEPFDPSALDVAKADFALLPSNLAGALMLAKQYGWQAVYFDNLAVVLVKNPGQFPKLPAAMTSLQSSNNAFNDRSAFPNETPGRLQPF